MRSLRLDFLHPAPKLGWPAWMLLAQSFGVFANAGIKQSLIPILKISDWKGKILEEVKIEDI